jgi:hypothetical protein
VSRFLRVELFSKNCGNAVYTCFAWLAIWTLFGINFAIYNDADKASVMVFAEIVIGFFGCVALSWLLCWCIPNTRREFTNRKAELDALVRSDQELGKVVVE